MEEKLKTKKMIYFFGEKTLEDVLYNDAKHRHLWVACTHHELEGRGSQRLCTEPSPWKKWEHEICQLCGTKRYLDGWLQILDKIFEKRRQEVGL